MEPTLHTYEIREYAPDYDKSDYISHGYYTEEDALFTLKILADKHRALATLKREYKRSVHYIVPGGEQRRIIHIVHVPA